MTRYRDLGLTVGQLPPGPLNAITDVAGVAVGVDDADRGRGPARRSGVGPIRTGVTVIVPHAGIGAEPVFAGCHRLNGNGELTGLEWVRESGQLTTPVAITNTHSVGRRARRARGRRDARPRPIPPPTGASRSWARPTTATLNDINGHARAARASVRGARLGASAGPVPEGGVGGGTGMICHEFKGGTGTASRVGRAGLDRRRARAGELRPPRAADGRRRAGRARDPGHRDPLAVGRGGAPRRRIEPGMGSIIVILATDAPMLPHQLRAARAARRPRHRAGGRRRRALERRHLPRVLDGEPRARSQSYKTDGAPARRSTSR